MDKTKKKEIGSTEVREYHTQDYGVFFKAKKTLLTKKSSFQKIKVIESESFGRILFLDGLVQTTEKDEFFYHEMLVHPALVSHPRPEKILIIGGGDGGALREVLRYPIKRVWLVEIDGQVIEASKKFFPWLGSALKDKRAELLIGDGDKMIRQLDQKFDVIIVDSSDPVGPSAVLHGIKFYERMKERLGPKGIVAAQAGSPLYSCRHLREKKAFLSRMFKHAFFYLGPVPTYPGGMWSYLFLSDLINPLKGLKRTPPKGLKYYNQEVHGMAFVLPEYLKNKLG